MNLEDVLNFVDIRGKYFYYSDGKKLHYKSVAYAVYGRVCEDCGALFNLTVHHVNHNHSDNRIPNLAIKCKECHCEHHRRYGGGEVLALNGGGGFQNQGNYQPRAFGIITPEEEDRWLNPDASKVSFSARRALLTGKNACSN